jgi:deferrochelatase/peroxidase EfeB
VADQDHILELDDIQSGVLRPRPAPYVATYIAFRIDDRRAGRELMRRASRVVTSAANPNSPLADTWVSIALSHQGLKALGVPQESLDSFSWEFRQGMAARAKELGDIGESSPENWEKPLGTEDVHVVLVAVSPDEQHLEAALVEPETTEIQLSARATSISRCRAARFVSVCRVSPGLSLLVVANTASCRDCEPCAG